MAKNSVDAYGAKGKTNLLLFDPEDVLIVTDPKSPLYDKEGTEHPINDGLVTSIMQYGVIEPIVVARDPISGKVAVTDGRQRLKACREANKRLKHADSEPVQIAATIRRGEDHQLFGVAMAANEFRREVTPLERARKAQRYLELGRSEQEIASTFGVSVSTIKNLLGLLEAPAAVKKAVQNGQINVATGYKLARLEPAKAAKHLEDIVQTPDKKARSKKNRAATSSDGKVLRGKREILELKELLETSEKLKENHRFAATAVVDWMLGDDEALARFM